MNRRENNQNQTPMTYDIYVGNVPKSLTETELKQVFVKFGEIKQVLCRWKEDCNGVGYGIVKFVFKMDAEKLLQETDEVSWNGHPLPIKAARRSDQNQPNGNIIPENKANCFSDFNTKPLFLNPPFLKGGIAPRIFCPPSVPYSSNQFKRSADDFTFMTVPNLDIGYFPNNNYQENKSVHSGPLNLEVLCTNVEDAITFYGCPVHRLNELASITRALASLNLQPNKMDRKPLLKKVYASLFSEDRSWYRCVVTRPTLPNKPGMCTVRYIDYGNHEEMSFKNIAELPEPLQKVPAFASKFVFTNLMCDPKANKQTYLHQLANKRMSLCAIQPSPNTEYQVSKCSCNGKDVIAETVKKGFAIFKKISSKSGSSKSYGSKAVSKSNTDILENKKNKSILCNGVNGYKEDSSSPDDNKIAKSVRKVLKTKDSSKNEVKKEDLGIANDCNEGSDFHPKMIIKRGSDLSDIVGSKDSVDAKKEKETKQKISVVTMDSVITNLKLINNIRTLVSQSTDDSTIQCAIELLQSENPLYEIPEGRINSIDVAHQNYIQAINEIKKCTDKSTLPNLTADRDLKQKLLCEELKEFLKKFDTSLLSQKNKIMQTITDLASNSNDWMNVELKTKPSSLKELVVEYNKVKEEKWSLVKKARDKTNERHEVFMGALKHLEKEFYLNKLENDSGKGDSSNINDVKPASHSVKFEETLKELGESVEEEIRTLTLNKEKDSVSIIQCLLAELDIHKEKVESVCELYQSKLNMYNELSQVNHSNELLMELAIIQEEVCSTLLRLTHCKDSNEEDNLSLNAELCSVLRSLHIALLKEDKIIERLAKDAEKSIPELCIEHPELNLYEYFKNDYLIKYNWKPEYFLNYEALKRNSFVSKIIDKEIIIKEYKHDTKEDLEKFIKIAVAWNRCRCEYLLKIQALFFKEDHSIYAICPFVSGSLYENPPIPIPVEGEKACNILKQLLICLKELHSQKIIYGAVHPSSILIDSGKILLDFCFNPKVLGDDMILKGINFLPHADEVSEKSGDMYGFGCLVLWLLFPNLSFTSTDEGVPNLTAFRSIIEEALTTKDYAMLCSLLSAKPKSRPSASFLLSKGFLTNYESYCRARNKAMSGS